MTTLLQLEVSSQRDILVARLRTRQIAKVLGFEEIDQSKMACAVFELVFKEYHRLKHLELTFTVREQILHIFSSNANVGHESEESAKKLQIAKPLPRDPHCLNEEDWSWVILQLERFPVRLFDEVHRLNQELLQFFLQETGFREEAARPEKSVQIGRAA